jgi:hypothetical protein
MALGAFFRRPIVDSRPRTRRRRYRGDMTGHVVAKREPHIHIRWPVQHHGAIVVTAHRVATGRYVWRFGQHAHIGAPSTTLGAGLQRVGAPRLCDACSPVTRSSLPFNLLPVSFFTVTQGDPCAINAKQ